MKENKISLLLLMLVLLFSNISCNTKFDKKQWADQVEPGSPPSSRSKMVDDLITNHKLIGLSCTQLTEYLGPPDYKDSNTITYEIIVDYGSDIDPVYTKNLEFAYSKDSLITSFRKVEWKK
jgi:hypothetical protein